MIVDNHRIKDKYVRCREVLDNAVVHIGKLESITTPLMEMMTQMSSVWQVVHRVEVPAHFQVPEKFAVAMNKEDLAQQVADRQHARAASPHGIETAAPAPEDGAEAPAAAAAAAVAPAATAAAAGAYAPMGEPQRQLDIRERATQRKVGITYSNIWELPRSENPTEEAFGNFLKLVKKDADYGGSVTEPEKADVELHNRLVIRLMAIMRHGSPLIPNPMWHFFAPLGRILSCIQQHKDFKDDSISEEFLLCALMTADCFASVAGTPYFQTLSIVKDETRLVFARADPANVHVTHSINSDGFRLAATPYKQGGKKGGKGTPYQMPAGNASQGWVNRGSGSANNSWWKTDDAWAATGKDPWNSPPPTK